MQAGAIALLSVLTACGLSSGLDEYVVQFAPGTPTAQARAVGEKCPRFGKAFLEPPGDSKLATNRAYPVRYNITNASNADKSALLACLKMFPIVRGVQDSNQDS